MFRRSVFAIAVIAALPAHTVGAQRLEDDRAATPAQAGSTPAATAQALAKSYAQDLVDRTAERHRELLELDLHARPPGESSSVIVASKNPARIGRPSDADDVEVAKTGTPFVEINRSGDQNVEVHLPLLDVNREIVGELEMTFPYPPGSGFDEDGLIKAGEKVRDEMARRILDLRSLVEPLQLDPRVPVDTYAQALVDDLLAKQAEVEVVAIHANVPGVDSPYPIVASNIGRIGKAADAADLDVIGTGKPHVQLDEKGARLEAKLPLQDASGNTIGVLAVVFPFRFGLEQGVLYQRAEKLRDDLRSRIASVAQLYQPKSVEPGQPVTVETVKQINQAELGNRQSLPMTKEVASAATLQNSAQDGYSEAVKNQAGVAPSSSKGSPSDTISIRGINVNPLSNYRINGGLAVAGVTTVPTEDKERLETLKGANALMFGIASPAGIINLVTKRAGDFDVTSVSLSGTSFGQYYGAADVGRRFGEDRQLGARVNVSAAHLENGVRDASGHGDFESLGVDWKATDRLSFQGDLERYRKQTILQAAVSILSPVNGVVPVPRVPDPRNLLSGTWATFDGETTNLQARADFIIADQWKVLAEMGRSDSDRSRFVTRVGKYNPVTGAGGVVTTNFTDQTFSNKFDRAELLGKFATGWFTHDLTIGYSESQRDAFTPAQSSITLPQRQNIFDPVVLPPPVATTPAKPLASQVSKDTGLYTYDTIGIGPKLKALLGFRQTGDTQYNGAERSSSTVNSPAFGFLYDVLPATTLFASYLKGLEDGAVAPATAVNSNQILPPGISTQREIGIRESYFRGLSINASVFDISRVNAVLDSVTNIFSNNGTIQYHGAEAVVAYEINRQWTLNAAGQRLNTVQGSDDPKINGLEPENTPRFIGNLFVTHRSPLVVGLTLNAGASFVTKRQVNPQDQGTIPAYTLYSASAGYVTKIDGRRASFQLSVDNLGNKRYWNSAQQGTFGTGMDRSFKLNTKVDF
jgi:TonB-dependent siderophore receptor